MSICRCCTLIHGTSYKDTRGPHIVTVAAHTCTRNRPCGLGTLCAECAEVHDNPHDPVLKQRAFGRAAMRGRSLEASMDAYDDEAKATLKRENPTQYQQWYGTAQ